MSQNSLLDKLDGLVARFEEVSTLITDPSVINDMARMFTNGSTPNSEINYS